LGRKRWGTSTYRLADQVVPLVAEEHLDLRVGEDDATALVDDHHGIGRELQEVGLGGVIGPAHRHGGGSSLGIGGSLVPRSEEPDVDIVALSVRLRPLLV
jgi:hypothetical protein